MPTVYEQKGNRAEDLHRSIGIVYVKVKQDVLQFEHFPGPADRGKALSLQNLHFSSKFALMTARAQHP